MKNMLRPLVMTLVLITTGYLSEATACPTADVMLSGNFDNRAPLTQIPNNPTFETLDASAEFSLSLGVVDELGDLHTVKVYFFHTTANTWTAAGFVDGSQIANETSGTPVKIGEETSIAFKSNLQNGEAAQHFFANWAQSAGTGLNHSWYLYYTSFKSLPVESNIGSITQDGSDGECKKLRVSSSDVDGDAIDDLAIWRPSVGFWAILKSISNNKEFVWKQWGLPGDYPMNGDYTGDGRMDLVVWRPSNGNWYVCSSDTDFDCSQGTVTQFGLPGDRPIKGDFDGDKTLDFAVWRPSMGWFIYKSSISGAVVVKQWGLPGDIPLGTGSNQ